MKRTKIKQSSPDERSHFEYSRYIGDDDIQLNSRFASGPAHRHQNTLEAEVQDGDTLQAIAIRYNCSVSDIKRLNKIERDHQIHAFRTIRVPQTPENLLVNHLPIVHTSGQNSPKHATDLAAAKPLNNNQIADALKQLTTIGQQTEIDQPTINDIILNTTIVPNPEAYHDEVDIDDQRSTSALTTPNEEDHLIRQRRINAQLVQSDQYSCSGSDCDMSWICLFICILALCFAIPLIYVVYLAEHHIDPDAVHTAHHST